jgi:hypothetical protein
VYLSCGPGLLAVRLTVGFESEFWYAAVVAYAPVAGTSACGLFSNLPECRYFRRPLGH